MPFIIKRALIMGSDQIYPDVIEENHIKDDQIAIDKLNPIVRAIILDLL